jgi:hypothetical protein
VWFTADGTECGDVVVKDSCLLSYCRSTFLLIFSLVQLVEGRAVAQLRHCATNRKVAGSIPHYVIEIFH